MYDDSQQICKAVTESTLGMDTKYFCSSAATESIALRAPSDTEANSSHTLHGMNGSSEQKHCRGIHGQAQSLVQALMAHGAVRCIWVKGKGSEGVRTAIANCMAMSSAASIFVSSEEASAGSGSCGGSRAGGGSSCGDGGKGCCCCRIALQNTLT